MPAPFVLTFTHHVAAKVFACEPEWAALTRELAGSQASVYTATQALQDPHLVQAKPLTLVDKSPAELPPVLADEQRLPGISGGLLGQQARAVLSGPADIHAALQLSLQDMLVEGVPLQLLDAYSAAEAVALVGSWMQEMDG